MLANWKKLTCLSTFLYYFVEKGKKAARNFQRKTTLTALSFRKERERRNGEKKEETARQLFL